MGFDKIMVSPQCRYESVPFLIVLFFFFDTLHTMPALLLLLPPVARAGNLKIKAQVLRMTW